MIHFHDLPKALDKELLKKVIIHFVEKEHASIKLLTYNFVTGEELLEMNKNHLQHAYETDILTFDYGNSTQIEAEIFISSKALLEAPERFNEDPDNEAIRLIAHGLFHCLGQRDKRPNEKKKMKLLEESFIQTFHVKHKDHV